MLTGAVVSPLAASIMSTYGGASGRCPWCGCDHGDFDHVVWVCGGVEGRPIPRPADPLQRRLFWPTGRKERQVADALILRWGVEIDRRIRYWRYNADGALAQFGVTRGNEEEEEVFQGSRPGRHLLPQQHPPA